ncbi:MAG: hypothetical protein FJX84_06545 [Bacteroidetes bacterium]|nr:hypothetical protein [Bacteroidota bacterium]
MNSELIIQEFSNEKFVQDTVNQICKDFSRCGWDIDSILLERKLTKVELEELLAEKLVEIIKFGETQLLQLIYIIDISEKEFLSILSEQNFPQLLAEKIVLKEAYKVFLRKKFS